MNFLLRLMLITISICDTCLMSAPCSRLGGAFTLYRCTLTLYFFYGFPDSVNILRMTYFAWFQSGLL